jgi:hypothetical protein
VIRAVGTAVAVALLSAPFAAAQDALPGGRALYVATSLTPETHLFAEPVVAQIDVVLDPAQLDPDRIEVRLGRFAPYELVEPVSKTRTDARKLTRFRFTATLRCLNTRCLAPQFQTALGAQEGGRPERYNFRFPPVAVLYDENGRQQPLLTRAFPTLEVVSRINSAELAAGGGYAARLDPPSPTYRIAPERAAALSLVAALLLLLLPGVLAGRYVRARWQAARRSRQLSRLERALILVEWTNEHEGEDERRKALEALADALERGGATPLADDTRAFAWAATSPDRERAAAIAAEARATARESDGRAA